MCKWRGAGHGGIKGGEVCDGRFPGVGDDDRPSIRGEAVGVEVRVPLEERVVVVGEEVLWARRVVSGEGGREGGRMGLRVA